MYFSKTYSCFLFLVLCFIFSCKKEKDDVYGPTITFTTPAPNQFYNVMTETAVNATVRDDTKITSVSVSLLDAQGNPAHNSIPVPVSSPSMTINIGYLLDNIHLESGSYSLCITASDGKNDTKEYQQIYLGAVPKVVKKVFVLSSSGSSTNLSFADSTFSALLPFHTFSGDYIGSSVSSYFQQGYECGNYTGYFTALKLTDNSVKFTVAPYLSASLYFTGYFNTEKNIYVARFDGFIKGYDYTGATIYNAAAEAGYYAEHFCFNNNFMVAEEQDKTSTTKKLLTYYTTGVAEQETVITQDVVQFCEKDQENVFIFGNSSGQGVIQLFDRLNNHVWDPYNFSLPASSLLSAVEIDNDTYLLGISNGTIYKYQYQNSSLTPYLTGYLAKKLKYDMVNNELYVVETNTISTFDYPTKTFHHSLTSADPISDIHLLYNR